jgi:CHAT domain-containing protein/Tfp pilus assembly protein PilF
MGKFRDARNERAISVWFNRKTPSMARRALAACALMMALGLSSWPANAGLPEECSALFERGNQYYQHGDYPRAVEFLERAARIAETAFGPENPNVSLVYNSLSTAYLAQGRFADAEPFLRRALQIRERTVGPNSLDLVPVLSNTAMVYDNQSRYEEAEALYKRVLSIQQATAGPDHPSVAISLGNLANLYQHQGRYGEAEASYRRALAMLEKAFGPDHLNLLFIIDNLAVLYGNEARHDDATRLFQRSLAIKEKALGPNNPAVALTLTNIASLYDRDGRFADAEELYKRVLAISEKVGRDSANTGAALNNLAAFYRARDRIKEAEPLYQRALAIQQKTRGPNHPDVATVMSNLAVLYDRQGRSADAEQLYKRSLAIDENVLGPDSEATASDSYALALLYDHIGRAAEAEPLFNRALAIRQKSTLYNPGNIALTLAGIAAFYDGQGRSADALAAARKAVAIWSLNGATAWDPNANDNGGDRRKSKEFLPELIRLLYQDYVNAGTSSPNILDEAFRASQSARGLETAQALAGMTARYASGSDALAALIREQQDLSSRSQALNVAVIKVLSQPPKQRGANAEATLRDEQSRVDAKLKADDERLRTEFPRFVELARAQPVGVADVQRVLGADEAFAVMTLGDKDSYLFVIRKDKASFFKLDLTRAQATQTVQALRATLVDGQKPFDIGKAHELYAKLLGPAEALIADARNLIVVPDGALESLPLSVLVTAPPDGKATDYKHVAWLIRRQALTILPAASSLVSLRAFPEARRPANPFAGFGDPDFRGPGGKRGVDTMSLYKGSEAVADRLRDLPRLADTAEELRAEARLLGAPDNSLHLGTDASVTTVKSLDLSNTRVIAFATHAGVAGELAQVTEPALALTPPLRPTPDDDGLLRASQVSQLRLNADFVILSACNTAAPDGTPGAEGLSGLAKAFFYAGARSLLVSHWEVQSDPTVKLTTGLIRAITADPAIGRAEALRRSILAMIDNSQSADDTHPAAWAPFVLAGEGGAKR